MTRSSSNKFCEQIAKSLYCTRTMLMRAWPHFRGVVFYIHVLRERTAVTVVLY